MEATGVMPWGSMIGAAAGVLKAGIAADADAPAPNQTASGRSTGGFGEGRASSGATGGAYGGAYSQSYIDGSNWIVNTGGGTMHAADIKSGTAGGFAPAQSMAAPQNPFLGIAPTMAGPSLGQAMASGVNNAGSGHFLLIGLALLAYVLLHK